MSAGSGERPGQAAEVGGSSSPAETADLAERLASVRPARVRLLIALAWPIAISYLLQNSYRINDQFWVQGLGPEAHAAMGAALFVAIMNFALGFLPAGGALALCSRAFGARDEARFASLARHALLFALLVGGAMAAVGPALTPWITGVLGLEGSQAEMAEAYLIALYLVAPAQTVALIVEFLFLSRGRTVVPMVLQAIAIVLNFLWTPWLVYGPRAAEALPFPGAGVAAWLASATGTPELGIAGAAWATGLARLTTAGLGLVLFAMLYRIGPFGGMRPRLGRMLELARISLPVCFSIALYAGVYWALLALVLRQLPMEVTAGLGLGFQIFEGLAYPSFLALGMAAASLVGRYLGAGDSQAVLETVASARVIGRWLGLGAALAFLFGGSLLGPLFTDDPRVLRELVLYVVILAFSQYQVAVETVNERILLGAGRTRSIPWISGIGNALRIPLGWALAIGAGLGGPGVWWAINLTTWLKSWLFWREVRRGDWL